MCKRAFVSGKVQGVGYRDFTRRTARALGLNGHARNLPDGRVEVLACGAVDAVAALLEKLSEGPRWARVDAIEVEDAACGAEGFQTN